MFSDVHFWTHEETLLLISIYSDSQYMFQPGMTIRKGWQHVSEELKKQGNYDICRKKCNTKFDALTRTYKGIKDNKDIKTGRGNVRWKYFDVSTHTNIYILTYK